MTCPLSIPSSTYYPHSTGLFILILFLYHPLVLTDHPHIFAFPALAFLSRPHLLAVFIYVSLIKTPGLGSKLLIDANISPLRDQLELLPKTIDIERYRYENMKIVLFRMMQ